MAYSYYRQQAPGLGDNQPPAPRPTAPPASQRGNFGPLVPPGASRGTLGGGGPAFGGGLGAGGGGGFLYGRNPSFAGQRTLNSAASGTRTPPPAPPPNPYGTESGNTYLEDRYLARLNGEDPAFNYGIKRGMEALGNRSAAAGNFNSGAARQQESDFYANMMAQQQAQLDALAGGATGARQNKVDSMFRSGLGMAGAQSGINSAYDLSAGNAMSQNLAALLGFMGGKAGVDSKSNQQGLGNIIALLGLI